MKDCVVWAVKNRDLRKRRISNIALYAWTSDSGELFATIISRHAFEYVNWSLNYIAKVIEHGIQMETTEIFDAVEEMLDKPDYCNKNKTLVGVFEAIRDLLNNAKIQKSSAICDANVSK